MPTTQDKLNSMAIMGMLANSVFLTLLCDDILQYLCTKFCWQPNIDNDINSCPIMADTVVTRIVGSISKLKNCNLPLVYVVLTTLTGPPADIEPCIMMAAEHPIIISNCATSAIIAVRRPPIIVKNMEMATIAQMDVQYGRPMIVFKATHGVNTVTPRFSTLRRT